MEREELLSLASEWLEDYEVNIKPVLKTTLAYAPSDVSILLERYGELTLFKLYYDMFNEDKKLNQAELIIKERLEKVEQEISEILMKQEEELEKLEELPEECLQEDEDIYTVS